MPAGMTYARENVRKNPEKNGLMASKAKAATARVDWSEIGRAKSAGVTIVTVETRGYATRYIIGDAAPIKGGDSRARSEEDAKAKAENIFVVTNAKMRAFWEARPTEWHGMWRDDIYT